MLGVRFDGEAARSLSSLKPYSRHAAHPHHAEDSSDSARPQKGFDLIVNPLINIIDVKSMPYLGVLI